MKQVKITDRNIMFTRPMTQDYDSNLGLILGVRHNFIIDTGMGSGSVAPILEYIANDEKPLIVINTHSHWDHVWGNSVFESGLIISHTLCRTLMEKRWSDDVRRNIGFVDGKVNMCVPNMVFDTSLHFSDDGVSIFHTPGHTADCVSIYDSVEKVLYAGDNIGDTDENIVPWIDTDVTTFRNLIETYKKLDFDFCVSGHNKPQTKAVICRMESALAGAWEKQNSLVSF